MSQLRSEQSARVLKLAVSPSEAADLLEVSRNTIYRLMERGEIRSFHIGRARRILVSEIERFAAESAREEEALRQGKGRKGHRAS
jgi:excisionase family DNA binding protein